MVSKVFMSAAIVILVGLLFLGHSPANVSGHPLKICRFDRLYQLGDSISDTGNLIREHPIGAATAFARLPYGETFFKKATGRCSNGFLMVDFIAMAAGLPLVPDYKNTEADFDHGANFAVAGSTALPGEALAAKGIFSPVTNSSLNVQLDWMSTHFNSICPNDHRECMEKLRNSLFLVGEIGGNDYNYALFQGKTVEELTSMVPEIVDSIKNGVKKAISYGATRMIVPGNFPIGCLPIYQTAFQTNNSAAYDDNHCLKDLNGFAMYHNERLQEAIDELKRENPNKVIVYGDYYNAYQFLLGLARFFGFDTERACCGIGGKFNFDMTRMCGAPGVEACSEPHRYMSWDGVHLTQEGYKIMTAWLIHDLFPKLHCPLY